MRLLFDAYWWHDGPPSGRMVVRELIRAWAEEFPEDDLTAFVRHGRPIRDMPPTVQTVGTYVRPHGAALTRLHAAARSLQPDAIVTQNFTVPGKNSCTFVHDVLFQSNPEYFTKLERLYLGLIPLTLPTATRVFTSSTTEAKRIMRHNRRVKDVVPVGLGIGSDLIQSSSKMPQRVESIAKFALAVGRLNTRKNLSRVFEAALGSTSITECPLVVVGEPNGKVDGMSAAVRELVSAGAIIFVGSVSDGELRWLYENASVLIFASLDEGFGLPPLEANHFGCPVILSDIPVFRELYSEIGSFVDPTSSVHIANALDRSLGAGKTSPPRPSRIFSWTNVVSEMRSTIMNG